MRLLDTTSGQFRWFHSSLHVPYAILSHVWDTCGEQSYQEVLAIQNDSKGPNDVLSDVRLSHKIKQACAVARAHGFRYLWIDSCCIDKASSAELSEAINSMFEWYKNSSMCYAYLTDVSSEPPIKTQFLQSRWHRRGWTLQELIAPYNVLFLAASWDVLGSKLSLSDIIEEATGVDHDILIHKKTLDSVGVAHRMWWASRRETTRVEDEAYCLMGLFGVHMPTIYGEGRHAFYRLQEEILRAIPDQSIFAWDIDHPAFHRQQKATPGDPSGQDYIKAVDGLFAWSTRHFAQSRGVKPIPHTTFAKRLQCSDGSIPLPQYQFTPHGVRTHALLWHKPYDARLGSNQSSLLVAILECEDDQHRLAAIVLGPNHCDGRALAPVTIGFVADVLKPRTRLEHQPIAIRQRLVYLDSQPMHVPTTVTALLFRTRPLSVQLSVNTPSLGIGRFRIVGGPLCESDCPDVAVNLLPRCKNLLTAHKIRLVWLERPHEPERWHFASIPFALELPVSSSSRCPDTRLTVVCVVALNDPPKRTVPFSPYITPSLYAALVENFEPMQAESTRRAMWQAYLGLGARVNEVGIQCLDGSRGTARRFFFPLSGCKDISLNMWLERYGTTSHGHLVQSGEQEEAHSSGSGASLQLWLGIDFAFAFKRQRVSKHSHLPVMLPD